MTSQNGFDYQLCADGSLNATSRPDITLHCHLDLEMTQGSQIQLFLLFQCLLSFKKKHRFIYLAMPGLSFGMWDQTQVYWEHSLRHWTIRKIPSSSDFFFSWWHYACMCTKSLQSCPTLWDPMDCSPPDSSVNWSGLPYHPPGDLPNPGIEPASLLSPELAGGSSTTRMGSPGDDIWSPKLGLWCSSLIPLSCFPMDQSATKSFLSLLVKDFLKLFLPPHIF